MQFDDLLSRYFGTTSIDDLEPTALSAGVERMQVDFGLSKDRSQRFALWSVLHLLGAAPDLDVAFASAEDRDAARNFMDLLAASAEPDEE
ncbi:MAG: hypothetical protein ACK4NZ_12930 [Tsuneonella sp.]